MNTYTESFEYATSMVRAFITAQKVVFIKDQSQLFGDESWFSNFFNFSLFQLTHTEVSKQLDTLLDIGDGEQKPFNTALARIYALYTQVVMACGVKFMDELEDNCIKSLMYMSDTDRNPRKNVYKMYQKIFRKHPVLVLSALGNDFFSIERMNFVHGKTTTLRPGSGSVK